jgi:hypothetical protein
MKTNFIAKNRYKVLVVSILVFVLLLFGNVPAKESAQQQPLNTGRYQALYLGVNNAGFHIIMIVNTETGNVEKRIFYVDTNDNQDIYNYVTKETTMITRKGEKVK